LSTCVGVTGVGLKTAEAISKVFKGENGMKDFKEWMETGKEKFESNEAIEFYRKYVRYNDSIQARCVIDVLNLE